MVAVATTGAAGPVLDFPPAMGKWSIRTIVCHLANAAYLSGEPVRWSKEQMDIIGKAGRDTTYYQREYRKPWKLPVYKA